MSNPNWLGNLTKKDEMQRALHGLYAAKDGWYKFLLGKKRYIAKPMPLADVLSILPARIAHLTSQPIEKVTRVAPGTTTIKQLSEVYLAGLWERHQSGHPRKLARRTYEDYLDVLARFCVSAGPDKLAIQVEPEWFTEFIKTIADKAATTRRREIIYITRFFNWAGPGRYNFGLYKSPVQFGPDFMKPDEGTFRAELAANSTHYTPAQFKAALKKVAPSPLLYAVGLLTLNAAFLPVDLVEIPEAEIDFKNKVHNFPRGKNSIPRKMFLMPETIAALNRYLKYRGDVTSPNLFVNERLGLPFSQRVETGPGMRSGRNNAISSYWSAVTGLQLKGLRTTIATELDGAIDQNAVDVLMGHAPKTTRAKHYVKHFASDRLHALLLPVWKRYVGQERLPTGQAIAAFQLARQTSAQFDSYAKRRWPNAESDSAARSSRASARRAPQARQR